MKKILLVFLFISQIVFVYAQPAMQLMSAISVTPNPVPSGSYVTISASIRNNGASSTFDFECDLETTGGGFVSVVKKTCNVFISSGATQLVTFPAVSPGGYINASPGNYRIRIVALFSSCFQCGISGCALSTVAPGSFVNPIPITVTSAYCGGTTNLTSCSSSFSDGSSSNTYCNNSNCSWLIQPTGATSITLSFSAFDVENNFDFVKVYNGTNATAPLLGNFTGSTIPSSVTSGSAMFVLFTSDNATVKQGWSASYSCVSGCTTPPTPTATSASSITANSFQANWNSSSGATSYRLDVSTNSSFSTFVSGYNNLNVGNTTSYSVTGLSQSTTYYYRVRACCTSCSANSNTISLTTTSSCTTPPVPTATSATGITSSSFQANWNSSSGATSYRLDVSTNSSFSTFVSGYNNLNVGNTTSYSVTGLSQSTTYYYRVRACCTSCSANSNTISLTTTTTCTTPPTPFATSATNIAFSSFQANWNNSTGATSYRLDVSTNSSFSTFVTGYNNLNVGNTTSYSVTGLTSGITYYYRVRACCTSCSGNSNTISVTTTPVTYWIGAYTRPESNPNFPNEKFLKSATSIVPATSPVKICADGSKATIIKLNCDNPNLNMQNIRFKIASDPTNLNPNLFGEFNGSSYYSSSNLAQVRFTHPNYLASGLTNRNDNIIAYDINAPSITLVTIPVTIYRAPILFVHGLWGGYNSFQEMDTYFINQFGTSNLITIRADYSANDGSAKSFSYNSGVLPTWLYNTLDYAIDYNFSSGKVDVIAHSMGGVLSRLYLQSASYLFDIHTLTTINSPHSGTQSANLLRSIYGGTVAGLLAATGKCITCGAVENLKINSPYFSNNLNGNNRKVPSLVYTSDDYSQNPFYYSDWAAVDIVYYSNVSTFILFGMLNPLMLTQQLYNPDISDVIVPFESQKGGVTTYQHYNQVAHTYAEKNQNLFIDLKNKLGQNPLSSFFNQNGFQHSNLSLPWWLNSIISLKPAAIADTIKIFNPVDSSIYNVGDTVQIDISRLSGNINLLGYSLLNQGQTVSAYSVFDSTMHSQFVIPSNVYGWVKALAYGLSPSGFDYDSVSFFVNISATLDSIQLQTDSLLIPVGSYQSINVNGFYNDSITRTVSTMPGMSYTILDTNVISLSGTNTIYAKQIGITEIIANYQGFSDTMIVTVFQGPNFNNASFTVANNVVCGSGDVQFTDDSGGNPIAWEWQFPGGTPSTSTDQNPLVNYSTFGMYDVTLITTWIDKVDTLIVPAYIIVDSIPSAAITPSGSTSFCEGQSVQLNANSGVGYNYFWSNGNTTQSITVSDSGDFSVTVIDSLGCNATSATETITVFVNPTPSISGNTAFCVGDSTILDAGSGYTNYLWSTTDTTQIITATIAGNYTVTVTDGNGCNGSTTSTVNVNPLPTPTITGNTSICQNDSSTLDAGSGYTNYLWSTSETTQTITATSAGSYTVTVTDGNGCNGSASSTIIVNPLPTPTIIGNTTICQNDSTILDAGSGYTNYLWSTSETTQTITATTAGSYTVTVTDGNGCNGSDTSTIIVNPLPTPTITGNAAICQNDSTTLDAGSGYTSYLWSTTETTQTISVTTAGTFTVTVTDGNGCEGTDNFILTVNNLPSPIITGIDTICIGDSTTLDAGSGYINYLWSTSATSQTITTSTAGTFSVTVTDVNGCSNSTSLSITVNSADTSVTANGFTLTANATSATYQWIYCDSVLIIGETNQAFVATQNGSYAVIVSQNGCTDTSSCYLIVSVGISQINGASNISIYPNPTNGLLNIKVNGLSNEKCKIILTNTLGQILNEKEFAATNHSIETQFDMKDLSSGIYFLGITSNKIKQTFKVQKQ